MAKKPDEGDPPDMETIMSLLKGLQTSLAGLKQDVSIIKLDNSRLSVAVNRLQLEQLFDEKNLFKEETPDTDGEPNESSDNSWSSSSRTSSSCSRCYEKTRNSDGKSSKRPHRDGKHREEHKHHSCKGIRSTPHVHKLKFPTFAGMEDPFHWIHKCEQFFRAQQTSKKDRVWLATYHLEGVAQQWYYRLEQNMGSLIWKDFIKRVSARFGPAVCSTPISPPILWFNRRLS
jgi:hypothetical protein